MSGLFHMAEGSPVASILFQISVFHYFLSSNIPSRMCSTYVLSSLQVMGSLTGSVFSHCELSCCRQGSGSNSQSTSFSFTLDCCKSAVSGTYSTCVFSVLWNFRTASIMDMLAYIPSNGISGYLFLQILSCISYFCLLCFWMTAILTGMKRNLIV